MPTVVKDITNYFKPAQVERMLKVASTDKEWLLVYLLWRTGRRVSEVLLLRPRHIDYDDYMIKWKILKKKHLTIEWKATDHQTIETIKYFVTNNHLQPEQFIFESPRVKKGVIHSRIHHPKDAVVSRPMPHLSRKWAFEIVRDLAGDAGIVYKEGKTIKDHIKHGSLIVSEPGWHPHHLRHSFAINYLKRAQSPAGLTMLQEHLGHSNISTTQAYLQFSQEDRVAMLNKIFSSETIK